MATVRFGGPRLGAVVGFASFVIGFSAVGLLVAFSGLSLPWAIAIGLGVVLLVVSEGAYRLWSATYDVAVRYVPTWERPQQRADDPAGLV